MILLFIAGFFSLSILGFTKIDKNEDSSDVYISDTTSVVVVPDLQK